jgi:glycosyltransferase involved in cell wall biosynthesis
MRISVVVPFRDTERHIVRCLGALVAQEPFEGEYEIVAVDDHSTDRSAALARRLPGVTVLTSSAAGPYSARNIGIAASAGDVIALTDGDCEASPDWLRQIAECFERPETAVLVGPRLPGRDSFALSLLASYERAKDEYVFGGKRTELYYASANNMALRRSVFEKFGRFEDRRRGSDTLFVRRVADDSSPDAVRFVPTLGVRHLEIDGVRAYYGKLLAYSRSMRRLDDSPGRILRTRERLAIWRAAVQRDRLSPPRAAAMFVTLCGGALCWTLGSLSGAVTLNLRS